MSVLNTLVGNLLVWLVASLSLACKSCMSPGRLSVHLGVSVRWRVVLPEVRILSLDSYVGVNQKEWGHVLKMHFHKRHMGILEIDNWAGTLRRQGLNPDMSVPVVETQRATADLLEESRVEGLKVTLGRHIEALRGQNLNVLKRTSKRAAELEDDDTDVGI